jgi:hypothetical protein
MEGAISRFEGEQHWIRERKKHPEWREDQHVYIETTLKPLHLIVAGAYYEASRTEVIVIVVVVIVVVLVVHQII